MTGIAVGAKDMIVPKRSTMDIAGLQCPIILPHDPLSTVSSRSPVTPVSILHATLVVAGFTLLFGWLYARPVIEGSFLAESDLYEQFLPVFLSPITIWSSYEFGGMPAFADPQDTAFYPIHFLFARIVGSWTAFVVSAFVMVSCFMYAYVYSLTSSRMAAAFAGLTFGLSEAMLERLAHMTTLHAIAWLPLMLLAIDRLRGPRPTLWVAIGAFAIASCILGGHPQIVLYIMYACGLYALTGGIVERTGWTYYARLAAALALGIGLTAVKAIPLAETSVLTARQSLGFTAFVSHANTPAQMLSILFSAIIHEGREAPTYVGLAALIFALTAAWRPFRTWRVAFWLMIAVVALLIGAGDATLVADLAYQLPLYDRFRVGARHLILAAFGIATLAGFGLAAIQRGDAPRRMVYVSVAALLASLVAGAAALAIWPQAFELDNERGLPWSLPIWSGAIWIELAIGGATALACIGFARRPHARAWTVALILVLICDLLLALPYGIEPTGIEASTIPGEAIRPSVHAARLAADMAPQHQRLLAPAGTQLDAVVPAAFARVWQIPIAGGYGPMLLARHSALAMMGTNGSVDPLVMADDNTALDLLAVKYIVMREEDFAPSETFERDGVTWASRPMNLPVGPPECGQRYPRTVSYALPPNVDVASIALVAHLRCSEDVPQGTEVARLHVIGPGEQTYQRPLIAGVDIAETGLTDPNIRRRAKHTTARVFDLASPSFSYVVHADLSAPIRATRMQIDVTGTAGWLEISRLTLIDRSGRSFPLELPAVLLETGRWREITRFATSRVTDRLSDEAGAGEEPYIVFENRRALPRAWVARNVMSVPETDMLTAVHYSHLPDGRSFDPAHTALVYPDTLPATTYPEGPSAAVVRAVGDGSFTIDVTTAGGGFLVLSESFYPGWRARIDARILPVYRTNISLQGVAVPPGRHLVEFELISRTLQAGAAVSILALVVLLFVAWRGTRA